MSEDPPVDPAGGEPDVPLLPGWSSLVILLTLFGAISAVTLLVILRADEAHVTPDAGGARAYGPADFPEIDFDEPLLPTVVAASGAEQAGSFRVPPPPFSEEGIYPCSDCHADLEPDPSRRELMFHDGIRLAHGPEDRWCLDCHDATNRDRFRLASGRLVAFEESYRLCGQCHGTIYRDWREGIHGRRRGYWNGAKSYLLCAHCHDPHAPAFRPIAPLPPPVRPKLLGRRAQAAAATGEPHP